MVCVSKESMSLLALDTSAGTCLVSLEVGDLLCVRRESNLRQHSGSILRMIDELLSEADVDCHKIERLAWNAGPGSFTGLRISASICQALSYSLQIPVLALSSLELMAASVVYGLSYSCDDVCLAVAADARMGGIYWACFNWHLGDLVRLEADQLVNSSDLHLLLQQRLENGKKWMLIGDGWSLLPLANQMAGCTYIPTVSIEASAMIAVAKLASSSRWSADPLICVPQYLNEATHWKKHQRKRLSTKA
jgi:tRNA threonylcarbamoyladenosine biosynthesis protein TsaB